MVFVSNMCIQAVQGTVHLLIPIFFLWTLLPVGSFALQSICLRLGGCLYATIGCCGKISKDNLSIDIVFQCLAAIAVMLGSFGWNVKARTGLSFLVFVTFTKAFILSILDALMIAPCTTFLLYPLESNILLSSSNLVIKSSLLLQIRTNRRASE